MRGKFVILAMLTLTNIGCGRLRPFTAPVRLASPPALPSMYQLQAGQLVFLSDFEVHAGHRLIRELTAERDDICHAMSLPASDEPITIYLFPDSATYSETVSYYFPGVPSRRAFFMETDAKLSVFAHWGDRMAEDLRHEVAHGYLHAVAPGLPLWLDEGLAEYFEVPRDRGGLNLPHLELITDLQRHNGWRPSLERLEQMVDIAQMDQQCYAEAWAWAFLLLESGPETREVLTAYLFDVRSRRGAVEPLSSRLKRIAVDPNRMLVDRLAQLQ